MCDVFTVARIFCEKRGWTATNLELQKLLYIAQVFSLGLRGKLLFDNDIEAWDYGPVIPDVYHKFKIYGATPIQPIMFNGDEVSACDAEETSFIDAIANITKDFRDWQLVGLTHRDGTAWKKNYIPQEFNIKISEQDMRDEFQNIWSAKNA